MADIEVERNHGLSFDEARVKAKQLLAKVQQKYGVVVDYVEGASQDVATAKHMGANIKGILDEQTIRFEIKLGMFAKPMKSKIKEGLEKNMDKYFA
ncbi:MAG: polyhydroxyalkanoic acid system protein [Gammaproteobacteria bacterium]|nr:MAG: polyhydroxyalkanoic acid system protein [Gammaproteobacteria bacterium]